MTLTLESINWPDGQDNIGGIETKVYWAPLADVCQLPEPKDLDAASSFSDLVTISTDITFKSGKGWHEMYITPDTGSVNDESVGEVDGKSFKNKFVGFHPGTRAEMLGWARWANNTNLVFLVPEADGQVRLLGSKQFPAKVEVMNPSTGEATEARKGTQMEFSCPRVSPAPIYSGAIDLADSGSGSC